jgi:beta-phosphoglucomutase
LDGWGRLSSAIFDVDGVLMASPHERAWREALKGLAPEKRFTTALYQAHVAGKPRLAGARAALEALGVPGADGLAAEYALRKQAGLEVLVRTGAVEPFPDALRLVDAMAAIGWPMAVASSSKNANAMMGPVRLPSGRRLLNVFEANVCGRDLAKGKPDPELFLLAAAELGVEPVHCLVVEDAPTGIEAAVAGRMQGLGIARLDDSEGLRSAGAVLVVTSLDEVAVDRLPYGQVERR